MKKKTIACLLALMLLAVIACPPALAADEIGVTIDGVPVVWTDAVPFIDENSRTLCPLRAVGEAMGLEVAWDNVNRVASFSKSIDGDGIPYIKMLNFPIGSTTAYVYEYFEDGGSGFLVDTIEMDTAAVIVNNRTYAPVRYLAEAFGCSVEWDHTARCVVITHPNVYWDYFANWEGYVGIYCFPGERFDEYESVELVAARINGVPASPEILSAAEIAELNEALGINAVYAFKIYGDFENIGTYIISWDTKWTYADGSSDPVPKTEEWVYECDGGYGGW